MYFIVRSLPSAISTHARDFFPSFLLRFSILRIQLPIQYVGEREAEISRGREVEVRNCNGPLSPEAKIKLRKRRCRRKTIWASRVRLLRWEEIFKEGIFYWFRLKFKREHAGSFLQSHFESYLYISKQ